MSEELKPCPFCGGEADPEGWMNGDGECGPECESCGATASSVIVWNRRAELTAIKAGQGEAVAIKSHGAWDGLDVLADLPDGTHLYTAPPASADAVSVPVELLELEWLEGWLRFAAGPIGQECCGRGGQECCGCPDPVYPCLEDVGRAMDERAKELRALLAQSESEGG